MQYTVLQITCQGFNCIYWQVRDREMAFGGTLIRLTSRL